MEQVRCTIIKYPCLVAGYAASDLVQANPLVATFWGILFFKVRVLKNVPISHNIAKSFETVQVWDGPVTDLVPNLFCQWSFLKLLVPAVNALAQCQTKQCVDAAIP